MSLAQIIEKIKNDAAREAEEIIAEANTHAGNIARRTEEENDAVKSGYARRFEVERPEIFRRREIVANLDVKKMALQAQRDLISDVYAAALQKLCGMGKDEYLALFSALLDNAVTTKEETVRVGAAEKYCDKAWLEAYNQKNGARLVLAEEAADIAGGFILENGRIGVNCSWEMLIQMAQEKLEADVIKRLFQPAD